MAPPADDNKRTVAPEDTAKTQLFLARARALSSLERSAAQVRKLSRRSRRRQDKQ